VKTNRWLDFKDTGDNNAAIVHSSWRTWLPGKWIAELNCEGSLVSNVAVCIAFFWGSSSAR